MTLTQMNYIITISETGSLNKAAEALYISQPSLTNAVKELEKELGIIIFNRSGRGVTLTNDGTEFLMYARQIYGQYESVVENYSEGGSYKKKFGYSRQTVRTALQQLEEEGLITRVRGSGTYVSYEGQLIDDNRPQVGLLLSYYSDYLFPEVYDGIESSLSEKGYRIGVAVTKNRLNDEAAYLEGMLKNNVSGLLIEGSRSAFPTPNIRL